VFVQDVTCNMNDKAAIPEAQKSKTGN